MLIKNISIKTGDFVINSYYAYTIGIAILVFVHSISARIPVLSLFLALAETGILIYSLFCRKIKDFTMTAIILLSTNIENSTFALGDGSAILFTVFNLPVVRGYLLLALMLLSLVKCYKGHRIKIRMLRMGNGFLNFYLINSIMAAMGVFMVMISLILNDNHIFEYSDMWRYMARDAYEMIHVIAFVTLIYFSLKNDAEFARQLKNIMLSILAGTTWAAAALIIVGNYYSTWGNEYYLTCPLILFFSPGLILFLYEKKGLFNLITGMAAFLIQVKFTVGIAGTWWLYIILVGVVFIRKLLEMEKSGFRLIIKLVCCIVLLLGVTYVMRNGLLNTFSGQVSYKLYTVLEYFRNICNSGSIYSEFSVASASISARIEEIVNVLIEIIKKPWFLLIGKGYGGTVIKHWGISNWNVSGSTFPDIMINHEVYSGFHISIAEIMINFGIVGMILIIFMIKEFISEFLKKEGNMWIILGILWFVFFYTLYYSFNLGIAWICYGLYLKYDLKKSCSCQGNH